MFYASDTMQSIERLLTCKGLSHYSQVWKQTYSNYMIYSRSVSKQQKQDSNAQISVVRLQLTHMLYSNNMEKRMNGISSYLPPWSF